MQETKKLYSFPEVSVIVSVYNVAPYIKECAESLFSQTLESIEYIFIDDASTDESLMILMDVVNRFPGKKNFIKLITHEKNVGIAAVRREGLLLANGSYVIYCDGDDFIEHDSYELMLREAKQKKADIIVCGYRLFGNNIKSRFFVPDSGFLSGEEFLSYLSGRRKKNLHGSLWNKLISHSIMDENIFPKETSYCEDLCALFSIVSKHPEVRISTLDKPLYNYRIRNSSLVTLRGKQRYEDALKVLNTLEDIVQRSSGDIAFSARCKIIEILYRMVETSPDIHRFSEDYSQYKPLIKYNRRLNLFEKIELRLALNNSCFAPILRKFNEAGRGVIKKIKHRI